MLPVALALAEEPDLVACTDLGPLVAEIDGELLSGRIGGLAATGTRAALVVTDGGRLVWTGALDGLHPRELVAPDPTDLAEEFARLSKFKAKGARVGGKGLRADVGDDGVLRGTWKGDSYAWALDLLGGVFGGPVPPGARLARLPRTLRAGDPFARHATSEPWAVLGRVVSEHLEENGTPSACGGQAHLWLEGGLDAVEAGTVAWFAGPEGLTRTDQGPAWHLRLPLLEADAAGLRAELGARGGVTWAAGTATVSVRGEGAAGQNPGSYPLLSLLRPDPLVLAPRGLAADPTPPELDEPLHRSGLELLRRLNLERRQLGLAPVRIDPGLTWAALAQCAWLDANPGRQGSRHDRTDAAWIGELPVDRGGADELSTRGGTPREVMDAWLAGPRGRSLLLHPAAQAAGACATAGGGRALDIRVAHDARYQPWAAPPPGMRGVPSRAAGADPLLQAVRGDGSGLAGPALTLWVPSPGDRVQLVGATLTGPAGEQVDTWVVRPGLLPGVDAATEAIFHLVPKRPLVPDATYRWSLTWTVNNADQVLQGTFQTAPELGQLELRVGGLGGRVHQLASRKRDDLGGKPTLRATVGAELAARLVAASPTHATAPAQRVLGLPMTWFCAPPSWFETWLNRPGADGTFDPLVADARHDLFGFGLGEREACVVFADAP